MAALALSPTSIYIFRRTSFMKIAIIANVYPLNVSENLAIFESIFGILN